MFKYVGSAPSSLLELPWGFPGAFNLWLWLIGPEDKAPSSQIERWRRQAHDLKSCKETAEHASSPERTRTVGWVFLVASSEYWIMGNCTLFFFNREEGWYWASKEDPPPSLCVNVSFDETYPEAVSVLPILHGTLWVYGIKLASLTSSALSGGIFITSTTWEAHLGAYMLTNVICSCCIVPFVTI